MHLELKKRLNEISPECNAKCSRDIAADSDRQNNIRRFWNVNTEKT